MSLADHIAAEESEPAETVTPAVEPKSSAAPVVADEPVTPEVEADSTRPDPDISEAARTLRKSRADERKAQIQREIADGVREREQTRAEVLRERQELDRLRRERESLSRGTPPRASAGAVPAGSTDPHDPEPAEADFPDDYGQFLTAHARWAARDEFRIQERAVQARITRTAAEQRLDSHAQKLDAQQEAMRGKFSDADVAIDAVLATFRGNPRATAVSEFLASCDVGDEVAYKLGKDAAALQAVATARNRDAVIRELTRLEVAVTPAPKPVSHVTKAPSPPSRTVGSGPTARQIDTSKPGTSTKDHYLAEQAEIEERQRQGR